MEEKQKIMNLNHVQKLFTQIVMWAFTLMTITSSCLTFYFLFTGDPSSRNSSALNSLIGLGLVILARKHLDSLNENDTKKEGMPSSKTK